MEHTHSFGYWLRRRRKALDLTQAALAKQVSCSLDLIQKIEADARRPSRQLAETLAAILGIDPAERTVFVAAARAERSVDQLALPAAPVEQVQLSPRTNLPAQLTALIGREPEIAATVALLRRPSIRLLTLTGPGGVGKTRLGLQVAETLRGDFADGVYFVDLAPVRDASRVSSAIAQTLGLREVGNQSLLDILKAALRDQQILLLLDNFEHVLATASEMTDLLTATLRLKILATSRERLHVRGEHEVAVPPLALPPRDDKRPTTDDGAIIGSREEGSGAGAAKFNQYEAVQLFAVRAQASNADFRLTDANAHHVAEICLRLDGLPLAIELAAARIRLFTPDALLARLDRRLALLTGGPRDMPQRQQTIRNTIAWSYALLDAAEQTLFRRLGVFVGGCTLASIEAVCADAETTNLLAAVSALVDKSLLQHRAAHDQEPRFSMLETVREYALDQLEASAEAEQVRRKHADYYLILGNWDLSNRGWKRPAQLDLLEPDYDNVWAALAWSQTSAGDAEIALQLTNVLRPLWIRGGMHRNAIAALERTLAHPLGVGRTLAQVTARFELGQFLAMIGNYAAARLQFEQTFELAREIGNAWWYSVGLGHLGWLAREQGDSVTAWAQLSESLAVCRELDDSFRIAETLNTLAEVAIVDEDSARAEVLLAESRALAERTNADPNLLGWMRNHLGHAAQLRGAYEQAAQLHHESLEYFLSYGERFYGLPWAYHGLGETAFGLGNLDDAARWLAQGLALSQTLGDQASLAWCLAGLGSAAALDEKPERAARLWGAAEHLRQSIGCRTAPAARATYERAIAVARSQLSVEAFDAAWAAGCALPVAQVVTEALHTS